MNLLLPAVLITAVLTGIIWLIQVLRFVDFMLNRGLGIGDFLYLTGLMLPSLFLALIPVSLGIAVVYTYQRLTSDSELIVLNAVGVSRLQLAKPALMMGALCVVICYALSLYLMPIANQKFRDIRSFFRDKYASVLLEEEVFNTPIDGITVFVRERDTNNNLHGVLLHDNRDVNNPITMLADEGRMEQTKDGPRFYLERGVRQELSEGRVSWLSFDDYALDIAFYAKNVQRRRDPDEKGFMELWKGDPTNAKEHGAMKAEAHHRLIWPLFALALPALALAFLFSGEYNRRGQWKRVVQATAAIILTMLVFFALRNMSAKHMWLTPVLYMMVASVFWASLTMIATGRRFKLPPTITGHLAGIRT